MRAVSEENELLLGLGELRPRRVGVDAERLDRALQFRGERDRAAPSPREHDAFAQRALRVADDALRIDDGTRAETRARGAGAVRAVEREHARLDRRQRDPAIDARKALRHPEGLFAFHRNEQASLADLERELDAVGEAALHAFLEDDAVDDDIEVVRLAAIELGRVADVDHRAVDAHAHEALFAYALQLELQLTLPPARDGREHAEPRAIGQREDAVDDLLDRLRFDALAAVRAMRDADARKQQAEVIRDLGDGAHRGARRLRERPLLDRDRRREPIDAIDVRLRELLEELPRIRGERLDVAALSLRVDRVERERRLTRAARAGEHDELPPRKRDAHVLQVVLPSAGDHQAIHGELQVTHVLRGARLTPSDPRRVSRTKSATANDCLTKLSDYTGRHGGGPDAR